MYPKKIEALIDSFKLLPGVGQKTAERYALHLLDVNEESVLEFAKNINDARLNVKRCERCHNLSDTNLCNICSDQSRNQHTICVVSDPKEVFSIERMNQYHGVYHVLDGLISTKKGILPKDINIDSLLDRINDETDEIILALNATVEGEMTALYLSKKIDHKVNVTRLAFGLPIGGHLDYADDMTLMKAFEGRNKL